MGRIISYHEAMDTISGLSQDAEYNIGLDTIEIIGDEDLPQKETVTSNLTPRQREVVDLLSQGFTRKEVAVKLAPPVSVQSIHQIVLRIRKSIKRNGKQ